MIKNFIVRSQFKSHLFSWFKAEQVEQEKRNNNFIQYVKNQTDNLNIEYAFNQLNYDELDFTNGWNLEDSDKINRIERIGSPFGDLYKTRNGIATLKNNIFIIYKLITQKLNLNVDRNEIKIY